MSTVVNSSPTFTADGSAQSLSAPTVAGVYRLLIDLSNMAASDAITLIAKQKILGGGVVRNVFDEDFVDAQVDPDKIQHSMYVVAPQGCEFTLEQTAGVNRVYPYTVDKLSDVVVAASGTKTLDGTALSLGVSVDNDEFTLLTDHAEQIGGDTVVIRLKGPATSGGTERIIEELTLAGAQVAPDIIRQSTVMVSPFSIEAEIENTGGANHDVPWALVKHT